VAQLFRDNVLHQFAINTFWESSPASQESELTGGLVRNVLNQVSSLLMALLTVLLVSPARSVFEVSTRPSKTVRFFH
jgi:hypothetical protein